MTASVAVIGGGYGGIAAAKALDEVAEVILIEPRDAFAHNVAALRGLVDPDWTEKMFLPYDRLLARGQLVRGRASAVDGRAVTLGSGERIAADYVVLASGSAYPFPAKPDPDDTAAAKVKIHEARDALAGAQRVLLLGAGPVGLELAGEITSAWPDKTVTIVDRGERILSGGFPDELRTELSRQLDELGVELLLGTSFREPPPSDAGQAKTFTVTTHSGRAITADIWFQCYGVTPNSDYLTSELASARQPNGHVEVTSTLQLPGQPHVFAIGDLTAIPEAKMANAAGQHAQVAAENIRRMIAGSDELVTYQPASPGITIPLGPTGGASYRADVGLLGPEMTAQIKGTNLMLDTFAQLLGLR